MCSYCPAEDGFGWCRWKSVSTLHQGRPLTFRWMEHREISNAVLSILRCIPLKGYISAFQSVGVLDLNQFEIQHFALEEANDAIAEAARRAGGFTSIIVQPQK